MARMFPVLLVFTVLVAGLGAALYPFLDCPECPAEGLCLRCRSHGRLTLLESRRRDPLDPELIFMLKRPMGYATSVENLGARHSRPRQEMVGWKNYPVFFFYGESAQVEGPGGPLVLTLLRPKTIGRDDGSPVRILLFDRHGRELDRVDASMPGCFGLRGQVLFTGTPSAWLFRHSNEDEPSGRIVISSSGQETIIDPKDWPSNWKVSGFARIVSRDGRLEVVRP